MVLKNPVKADNYLVRRLTVLKVMKWYQLMKRMNPFFLEKDQCWVDAENKSLKPKVRLLYFPGLSIYGAYQLALTFYCKREANADYLRSFI